MTADRRFRFGLVAAHAGSAQEWTGLAQRAERLGYAVLLVPDTTRTLAPFPACAVAAAVTTTLRVGPYVLAAPLRPPAAVAWEAHTMALLTGGRFELGLGAGRPDAAGDARVLGVPFGTATQRIAHLEATLDAVCGDAAADGTSRGGRPSASRLLVAAGGPRMLALAARRADTVALGLPPEADDDSLAAAVATVRAAAGERFDHLELSTNLLAVGEETPERLRRPGGADVRSLAAAGSYAVLTGSSDRMVDVLRRRRDLYGISYVTAPAAFADVLAPVVERLAGS